MFNELYPGDVAIGQYCFFFIIAVGRPKQSFIKLDEENMFTGPISYFN